MTRTRTATAPGLKSAPAVLLPLLLLLPLFLAPRTAAAADLDVALFHLGPVNVIPTLNLKLGHTSNLYLESDRSPSCGEAFVPRETGGETGDGEISSTDFDPVSSTITTLTAGLRLLLPVRDLTLGAGGYAERNWYSADSRQDHTAWKVFGSLAGDFPGGLGFTVKDTYEWGWLLESFEFGEGEDYTLNEFLLDTHYTFHDKMRIRFEWVNWAYDYEISADRDRTENVLTGTIYRRVAPKTAALVALDYAIYDYDLNPAADNTSTQLSAGVTWEATDRGTALLQAGYEWKRYDNDLDTEGEDIAVDKDGEYYTLGIGIRYIFGRGTNTSLDMNRRSVESDFQENPYFVRSSLDAGISQRLFSRFTLGAGAGVEWDDYPNETVICDDTIAREDTTGRVRGRLAFDLVRNISLAVEIEYSSRDSNFDIFDYDDTRFFLTLQGGHSLDWLRPRRR